MLCAFCAVMPTTTVLSSGTLTVIFGLTALLGLFTAWRDGLAPSLPTNLPKGPLVYLALLLLGWAALSSLWTYRPDEALLLALRLGALGLACAILVGLALRLAPAERAAIGRWLCIGFAIGLVFLIAERLSGSYLHYLVEEPRETRTALAVLNRGATGMALLVWPVTAVLYRGPAGRLALLLPTALLVLLLFYESQAAIIGVVAGLAVLLCAALSDRLAMLGVALLLVLVFLGGPIVADLAPAPTPEEQLWLPHSAKHRLHIWEFAAARIYERSLFGWGFDSAFNMPNMGAVPFDGSQRAMPSHPHNGVLQIWLELGLVGALLTLALLIAVWRQIGRLTGVERAAALALLVTGFVIACISYGVTQSKWVTNLLAVALVMVASRGDGRVSMTQTAPEAAQPAPDAAPGEKARAP